jgi:hypothetical protein
MSQLFWANVIDFYQPPNFNRSELEKVVNRSYIPLVKTFEQLPRVTFTVNLPGSTVELLIKTGFGQLIKKLAQLAERGQIDFTMTPNYQPLIPLAEDDDIDRQMEAHNKICTRYFGIYYKPQGLYSPYLSYNLKTGKIGARYALKWVIVDEFVVGSRNHSSLFMDKGAGGILLMPSCRETTWRLNGSFRAKKVPRSASEMIQYLLSLADNNTRYLITVSDAANFGHVHPGRDGLLRALYQDGKIRPMSVSHLRRYIKRKEFIKPADGSSETFNDNAKRKIPFSLWENDKSPIQQTLWNLYKMASAEIKNAGAKGDPQYIRAREMMDMASAAVNWDRLSCRPWWDSSYALKAAEDLAIAVFVILSSPLKAKEEAIKLRQKLYDQVTQFERSGEVKKAQQAYLKVNGILPDRFYKNR